MRRSGQEVGAEATQEARRDFLKATAVVGVGLGLGGCEKVISEMARRTGSAVPGVVAVAGAGEEIDGAYHLLNRAGFGAWPGDVGRVREMGQAAWVEEQLSPETIDDRGCDLYARRFESIHLPAALCYEFKRDVLREELTRHTLLRAVYSKRQLYESMVHFWTNHLNIDIEKGDCVYLKGTDDREVVRAHALGTFKGMIRASAVSGAMLDYLDGKDNKVAKAGDVPNENYARELLELHTLGVDGGYTQKDVYEVARCLTGWTLRGRWRRGEVAFDASRHDDGAKVVLGVQIPAGGGEKDLESVVEIVSAHPSTARHMSRKLCRWFVSDEPNAALVGEVAGVFTRTQGDMKAVIKAVLMSEAFGAVENRGVKTKAPVRFIASALRALGADTHAHRPLVGFLERMGQAPFGYPTPEGYPDDPMRVLGTLLWRWNFALAVSTGALEGVEAPVEVVMEGIVAGEPRAKEDQLGALTRHVLGRGATVEEREAVLGYVGEGGKVNGMVAGLLIASPGFQRY
jgi:uncharacterized protein (DUF1800 family)